MPERYAPGLLALHATAACGGEDTPLQNGASRVRPKLIGCGVMGLIGGLAMAAVP